MPFFSCFDELGDREATLGVSVERAVPHGVRYVYGADDRPRGSRVRARFFMLALPTDTEVAGVRAVDAEGHTVGRRQL